MGKRLVFLVALLGFFLAASAQSFNSTQTVCNHNNCTFKFYSDGTYSKYDADRTWEEKGTYRISDCKYIYIEPSGSSETRFDAEISNCSSLISVDLTGWAWATGGLFTKENC